jgi:hypothetical protein
MLHMNLEIVYGCVVMWLLLHDIQSTVFAYSVCACIISYLT